MKQEVSNKITMYNFFMTMGIVFYHFWLPYNKNSTHWTRPILRWVYRFFNNVIGMLAMSVFFMFSGFLLYNGANSRKDIYKKMKNRIFTLIVPFIIWNVFMLIYLIFQSRSMPFTSFSDFILGFTGKPFNGPLWYLLALSLLMLFAPLIINLKKHKHISLVVLLFTIVLCNCVSAFGGGWAWYNNITKYVWYIPNIITYLPFYAIGVYAGMHHSKKILNEEYNTKIVSSISLVLFLASVSTMCVYYHKLLLIISTISFWFSIRADVFNKKPAHQFKISFFIYAMHCPFLIDITLNLIKVLCGGSLMHLLPIETAIWRILGAFIIWGLAIILDRVFKLILGNKIYLSLSGNRTINRK